MDAVIGQDRMDPVGHGFQQVFEKLPCRSPVSLIDQLGYSEPAGAVDFEFAITANATGIIKARRD